MTIRQGDRMGADRRREVYRRGGPEAEAYHRGGPEKDKQEVEKCKS